MIKQSERFPHVGETLASGIRFTVGRLERNAHAPAELLLRHAQFLQFGDDVRAVTLNFDTLVDIQNLAVFARCRTSNERGTCAVR